MKIKILELINVECAQNTIK